MSRHNNGIKQQIQEALEHHQNSQSSPEEQWLTRAAIARYLKAPSGTLNPTRKFALTDLVGEGVVEMRKKPDDGKETSEYRLKSG